MQDEPKYFEQCGFVNTWKKQLGRVSVLAFLDPAWQYSFRQAVMLKLLSTRLRKSGFPDIRFFVIAPPPDLTEDRSEDDYEIEAWRKIAATYETREDLVNADELLFKDSEQEMIFLQDDPQLRMWEKFRASKDQVVVIDRCGKLTYQVMVPWSILYFPYVKAAILSTYQEDPCGGCDPIMYQALDYEEYFPSSRSTTAKETDPPRETDDNVDAGPMWTTERWSSRNVSAHLEESPSTVSPVISDKMTYDSDDDPPNFSSMTESSVEMSETAYRYDNSTTESSPNENDPMKETRRQEDSSTSSESATSATIELQQDVPPRRDESASMSDNSIILSNESTTGEIKNEFVSTTETTISDIVAGDDEIRDKDEDAEYEQNDSGR
ncbi:flocculation protein flo11-like isoform x2 protein [Lasius niger]|uniref:Flocculation protein flo11-like isoform x2 protein n=1 Tax=Lasius niger TaxID=67767 RepID=A0A0J7NEP2_LASNI|nr:flocculation protein flo11-like isoform x2 protein [Lasius niger]